MLIQHNFNPNCMVVYTSLKTNISGSWNFDIGCSRQMIGDKNVLVNYVNLKGGKVTYKRSVKDSILGKGILNVVDFPKLHNVLHVDGLTANLISIGQLCDDGMFVKFHKNTCVVYDENNTCIMFGSRSSDNYYLENW